MDPSSQSPALSGSEHRTLSPIFENRSVPVAPSSTPATQVDLTEIYYTLFRHKWKIAICTVLGLAAAGAFYYIERPLFISQARLFVRYVITDAKTVRPGNDDVITKSPDMSGETIMASEEQILTSMDLVTRVAERIGPERLLGVPKTEADLNLAAILIRRNLVVDTARGSSVIAIGFKHADAALVQPTLREILDQYLKMHVDVHRAAGMVGDFLAQETDQLRTRLAQTEDELRKANQKAGVISLDEAKQTYSKQLAGLREQILAAQAELGERSTILNELTNIPSIDKPDAAATTSVKAAPEIPAAKIEEYRRASGRLELLQRREQELLMRYTADSSPVRETNAQITVAEAAKRQLEHDFPALAPTVPAQSVQPYPTSKNPTAASMDLRLEAARVTALQAKIKILGAQADSLRAEAANLDTLEGRITELRRKKQLEEGNYLRYAASLEQSRINEALGSGKVSNISQIQAPSVPMLDASKTIKITVGIGIAGLALGLAWAFAIELVFDRSVRRPSHVARLRLPLILSIPRTRQRRQGWLRRPKKDERMVLPGQTAHSDALLAFHETLRDRVISYFERQNLTHKPKLVAVTGLGAGAGVTTIAAGMAQSLSDTADGNVLLVDMTTTQGSARQFAKGKPTCGMDEMLDARGGGREGARVDANLYVVTESRQTDRLSRNLPQRFSQLVPKLKASDFDYIIFDMPAVSEISITPRLAGFMDIVLLVTESEKTDRDALHRATTLLAESNAHVGAVLNKTKRYLPSWLEHDLNTV